MGKSFSKRDFYDDMDFEYEDGYSHKGGKKKTHKKDDKRFEIQQARKKAQAERDKANKQFLG